MTDIIIYLGMSKTGTSFLVSKVFPRIENIEFYQTIPVRYKFKKDKVLISGGFCGTPFKSYEQELDDRDVILDRLHKLYPDARILLTVRKADSMINSLYSQYLEYGGKLDFDEFKATELNYDWLDTDDYIKRIRRLFPELYVADFELLKTDVQQYVEGICKFIGVDTPEFEKDIVNKGWNRQQKRLGRFLNKFWKTPRYYIDTYLVK